MSKRFPQMDEKSLELDARYMGIKEKMSRVELHRQALTMLRESGLDRDLISGCETSGAYQYPTDLCAQ